jgi:hypothetical protein
LGAKKFCVRRVDELKKAYGADGFESTDKQAKEMAQLFASLEDQLRKADTLQYTLTIHRKTIPSANSPSAKQSKNDAEVQMPTESTSTDRILLSGPDLAREEHSSDLANEKYSKYVPNWRERNYVHIVDSADGKEIYLYPDAKSYRVKNRVAPKKNPAATIDSNARSEQLFRLQSLFMVSTQFVRQLPPEVIGGKSVEVFGIQAKGNNVLEKKTYWVDPQTKRLIKTEQSNSSQTITVGDTNTTSGKPENIVSDDETTVLTHDFIFDAQLDKALFATDPPPGWINLDAKSQH